MIVKIQVPLSSNAPSPPALVYDDSRNFTAYLAVTPELLKWMAGRAKAFFEVEAVVGGNGGNLKIIKEVEAREW